MSENKLAMIFLIPIIIPILLMFAVFGQTAPTKIDLETRISALEAALDKLTGEK